MIAAIYSRKSTDQSNVADEQRSVTRQIDHARQYATKKGWTVEDRFIFVDDGISGAEFANRPGFLRLMNALKPHAPFQVLVMSEESRLGREAIETAYALKQLVQAGVRVFFYLEDRERTLDSPTDKIMLSLATFADELEREKARQRTYDAMRRKAQAGHVTGGRVFGYDNKDVPGPAGTRAYVVRQINESEATIVRQIFSLSAAGAGYARIAKTLNGERAVCPRAQQGRPHGWAPTSVRDVLHRPLYRGDIVWNQTAKRDRWGRRAQSAKPKAEWIRQHVQELQIVSDDLWHAVHDRFATRPALKLVAHARRPGRPPRDAESPYLLSGFAKCGVCGGGMGVVSRSSGKTGRSYFYGCLAHYKRGSRICANGLWRRIDAVDEAVIHTLGEDMLRPVALRALIAGITDAFTPESMETALADFYTQRDVVDRELTRLATAVALGGPMDALMQAMQTRQIEREGLTRAIAGAEQRQGRTLDPRALEAAVLAKAARWQELVRGSVHQAREMLRDALVGTMRFSPEGQVYRFEGTLAGGKLLAGLVLENSTPPNRASPLGTVARWSFDFLGRVA